MNRFIISAFWIVLYTGLFSQEYGYEKYTVENGLVQNQVLSLHQDQNGFIWIGSYGGISRFDGLVFENFDKLMKTTGVRLFHIYDGNDGKLWFFSPQSILEVSTGRFESRFLPADSLRMAGLAWKEQDHDIDFLVSDPALNMTSVYTYRKAFIKNGKLVIQPQPLFKNSQTLEKINSAKHNDTIWMNLRENGLGAYSLKSGKFSIVSRKSIIFLHKPPENELMLLCHDAIYRKHGKHFKPFVDLSGYSFDQSARFIYDHTEGIFIINGDGYLVHIDHQGRVVKTWLKEHHLYTLLLDEEKNIWIGSESGLFKVFPRAWLNYNVENSGINPGIWSIVEDEEHKLWFGSLDHGLQIYDGKVFSQVEIGLPGINPKQFYMGSVADQHGSVWINNHPNIIIARKDRLLWPKSLQKPIYPMILYEDQKEDMIVAGCIGKAVFIKNDEIVKELPVFPGNKSQNVAAVTRDKNGYYWFGGFNGLSVYNNREVLNLPCPSYNFDIPANALFTDHRQNIWMGNNSGLYVYNYHELIKIEHPYLNTFITSITVYDFKQMLIGTTNGLCIFDLGAWYRTDSVICQYFNRDNGFFGQECGQNGTIIDAKGRVWIPGSGNVVMLNPRILKKNLKPPRVFIEKVFSLNKNLDWVSPDSTGLLANPLKLKHHMNNIRIGFHASSLKSPQRITYSWFLEGYDEHWSKPSKDRNALYSDLDPGEYTFKVVAINEDGIVSETPASLTINIIPSVWQILWFKILLVILISAIIYFILRKRYEVVHRKKAEAARLEHEITLMKLSSFRNQLDPHFTFNTINSILGIVLKENKKDAYNYIQKFAVLLRMIINYSDKVSRPLYEELNVTRLYLELEKMRFRERVNFEIRVEEVTDLSVEVPKMIIQTFVENAVKHGIMEKNEGGRITVNISSREQEIHIVVDDNGVGRKIQPELTKNQGTKGLDLLNQYISLFNYKSPASITYSYTDKKDENELPLGTRVDIIIPVDGNFRLIPARKEEISEEEKAFFLRRLKGIKDLVSADIFHITPKPGRDQ